MIVAVGMDVVLVERFVRAIQRTPMLAERLFTDAERFTSSGNAKIGIFYLSVMPAFIPPGVAALTGALVLAGVHAVEGVLWLSGVVVAVRQARDWLSRPAVARRLEQFTGVVFLGFGLRLALERSPR